MPMNTAYTNALRDVAGVKTIVTHIGLVNGAGTALAGARLPVTWVNDADDGRIKPSGDLTFDVASGETVGGWQGYSALTAGTAYGVVDLVDEGPYAAAGTYTLQAASTFIDHNPA